MGRYVFTPEIFDALEETPARASAARSSSPTPSPGCCTARRVYGWVFSDGRYDIGKKLDYLRATVEMAVEREDLGPEFRGLPRRPRRQAAPMIPLDEARAYVLGACRPGGASARRPRPARSGW